MNKIYTLVFFLIFCTKMQSQNWQLIKSTSTLQQNNEVKRAIPLKSIIYKLDFQDVIQNTQSSSQRSKMSISLPNQKGEMISYQINEDRIMEEDLARRYSKIKVYEGYDVSGKRRIRLDIGEYGLNAIIIHEEGTEFISPVYENNKEFYHVYDQKDAPLKDMNNFCGTVGQRSEVIRHSPSSLSSLRSNTYQKLEYRFALACTGEWGRSRGTVEKALSDMVTSVNILNAIYEVDLGMKLILINRNDSLIHLDPATDPYQIANVGGEILPTNTGIINGQVGANAYDLGHVFTNSCTDVGGVAFLSVICGGNKGAGVSCIGNNLTRAVTQIVAHEIGHQLGARHTFHSCGDNVSPGNDFEPGSGSTIMGYGGLCGTNNVVTTSDGYFHSASLDEIFNNIRRIEATGFKCANKINGLNVAPIITQMPVNGLIIPKSTPFILQGKVTDSNQDELSFCWEQRDSTNGSSTPLGSPSGNAPLFRSLPPSKNNFRVFPRPSSLLVNKTENIEVLPSYARNMNFSLTVRDNNKEASATVWALTSLKVDGVAGPFKISSQNQPFTAEVGSAINVTWAVAETDKAPVNCKAVDIFLSIDGELNPENSKMIPLAKATPNDGMESIIIPSFPTVAARIVVKASENVFFDVNDAYFTIIESNNPRAFFEFPFVSTDLCLPSTSEISLKSKGISNYIGKIKYEVTKLPIGAKAVFSKSEVFVGEDVTLKLDFSNDINTGRYLVEIKGIGEVKDTLVRTLVYDVVSNNFKELALTTPENSTKSAGVLPEFNWSPSQNAEYYQIQVATSPTFQTNTIFYQDTTTFSSIRPKKTLNRGTLYFWRVRPQNSCGFGDFTSVNTYGTVVSNCQSYTSADLPITLSASGRPTAEAKINIDVNFEVSDVNVKKLNINHDNFQDLAITLKSPSEKSAVLLNRNCPRRLTLDASFDDEAPNFFSCITGVDLQFKPLDSLARFKGLSPRGQWSLKVDDLEGGNGGRVNTFILEVCGDIPVENPILQIKNSISLVSLQSSTITKESVITTDKNVASNKLVYTIVKNVNLGTVFLNNVKIDIGSTFTQEDIDLGRLKYTNSAPSTINPGQIITDSLRIIVQNGIGGFDGVKNLNFNIQSSVTSIKDLEVLNIKIYPNPARNTIRIDLNEGFIFENQLSIFDITGRKIYSDNYNINQPLDVTSLKSGVYMVMVESDSKRAFGRFIKE